MGKNQKLKNEEPDLESAWKKIRHYCAYQERSRWQVRRRLDQLGVPRAASASFLENLEDENFLNEGRFAVAFARGKFYHNGWGRMRIRRELGRHQLPDALIEAGIREIAESDYRRALRQLLRQRLAQKPDEAWRLRQHRAAQYAFRRGYETELIWSFLEAEDDPASFSP